MTTPLDARLRAALEFIEADAHADIGSDHARLPIALVREGRAGSCLIVEKTSGPAGVARQAVARAGLSGQIEVREGDGFAPLGRGEVDSASLTGMGANTIEAILNAAGERPPRLVLQPNTSAAPLRVWARGNGYHLAGEALAPGFWTYAVLSLRRADGEDPAYDGLPPDLALAWGPQLLKRADALLVGQLRAQHARLKAVGMHGRAEPARDLHLVEGALEWLNLKAGV